MHGPYLAASVAPAITLPSWEPAPDPAPFDLSTTTGVDPRLLAAVASDQSETDNIWHVDVLRLPLRAGPSLVYPELGALTLGQKVISDGVGDGDWIWVRTEDYSISGYVASNLISR
ncbi:MAG: hypothetical protein B7Z02_02715 [Rhodobacterales bacterium 32-67-9]|nr:MAG: hypothetical protein B7Z02_02715 [Rhodobacterales bacterium 32-67-9]